MTEDRDHLEAVAARLREERPQADPLQLDRIKLRALNAREDAGRTWFLAGALNQLGKGTLMTSRLMITMLLALGIMMSGAGATLAVSGLSDDQGSAAQVQYPDDDDDGGVGGEEDEGGEDNGGGTGGETGGGGGGGGVLGEQDAGGGDTQPAAQTAAGDDTGSLAFTGFAALPLLALGLGLLSAGVVMRRRARPGQDA